MVVVGIHLLPRVGRRWWRRRRRIKILFVRRGGLICIALHVPIFATLALLVTRAHGRRRGWWRRRGSLSLGRRRGGILGHASITDAWLIFSLTFQMALQILCHGRRRLAILCCNPIVLIVRHLHVRTVVLDNLGCRVVWLRIWLLRLPLCFPLFVCAVLGDSLVEEFFAELFHLLLLLVIDLGRVTNTVVFEIRINQFLSHLRRQQLISLIIFSLEERWEAASHVFGIAFQVVFRKFMLELVHHILDMGIELFSVSTCAPFVIFPLERCITHRVLIYLLSLLFAI